MFCRSFLFFVLFFFCHCVVFFCSVSAKWSDFLDSTRLSNPRATRERLNIYINVLLEWSHRYGPHYFSNGNRYFRLHRFWNGTSRRKMTKMWAAQWNIEQLTKIQFLTDDFRFRSTFPLFYNCHWHKSYNCKYLSYSLEKLLILKHLYCVWWHSQL